MRSDRGLTGMMPLRTCRGLGLGLGGERGGNVKQLTRSSLSGGAKAQRAHLECLELGGDVPLGQLLELLGQFSIKVAMYYCPMERLCSRRRCCCCSCCCLRELGGKSCAKYESSSSRRAAPRKPADANCHVVKRVCTFCTCLDSGCCLLFWYKRTLTYPPNPVSPVALDSSSAALALPATWPLSPLPIAASGKWD